MSEKQPYENHLAEKLRQLPPMEGVDRNWVQMKALLDRDMPRGGGFGSSGKGGRWWMAGIIVGILIIGTWFISQQMMSKDRLKGAVAVNQHKTANSGTPSSSGGTLPGDNATGSKSDKSTPGEDHTLQSENNLASNANAKPAAGASAVNSGSNSTFNNRNNKNSTIANNSTSSFNEETGDNNGIPKINNKTTRHGNSLRQDLEENNLTGAIAPSGKSTNNNRPLTDNKERRTLNASLVFGDINYTGSMSMAPAGAVGPYDPANLSSNMTTQQKAVAANARAARAAARERQEEKTFAFGLSLPLAFPLGDQKALGYNSGAGSNTVSDYLPAPHAQYFFNSKTYLQTELQLMSPQFIRPLLLYQTRTEIQPNSYMYNNVYARKLYYFNVPVSIYHSPFKNFYMGTGLQFSTMLSGVALYEQRSGGPVGPSSVISERFTRFGNDSLSERLNTAEVRLLLEFNYYRNRFTVGLRYNQAFNNYANFQVNNNSPYTYDKNKALQFYLRYNIWQDKKRKVPAKPTLALK